MTAVSCVNSFSTRVKIICFAWSLVYPEIRSSSDCCLAREASTLLSVSSICCCFSVSDCSLCSKTTPVCQVSHSFCQDFLLFELNDLLVSVSLHAVHATHLLLVDEGYDFLPSLQGVLPFSQIQHFCVLHQQFVLPNFQHLKF